MCDVRPHDSKMKKIYTRTLWFTLDTCYDDYLGRAYIMSVYLIYVLEIEVSMI